jgi:hypothetical protein
MHSAIHLDDVTYQHRPVAIRLWGSEAAVQAGLIEEVLEAIARSLGFARVLLLEECY